MADDKTGQPEQGSHQAQETSAWDSSVDEAMDGVFTDEPTEPIPTPAAEESEEPDAPVDDQDASEEDAAPAAEEEPPPAAEEPAPASQPTGDPLTPEEEFLLKRNGIGEAEMEVFRSLSVEQRNLLLRPARAAQQKLNHLYGLSKEERERAISQERQQSAEPQVRETEAAQLVRQRIAPDKQVLDKFAAEAGITAEAVNELVAHLTEKQALYLTELEQERQARVQSDRESTFMTAVTEARGELAKVFPKLAQDAELAALLNEPETFGLWQAKASRGKDVGTAIKEALRERASVRYMSDLQQQTRAGLIQDQKRAHTRTAEPTSRAMSRGAAAPKPVPADADAAMDQVWEEHVEATRD